MKNYRLFIELIDGDNTLESDNTICFVLFDNDEDANEDDAFAVANINVRNLRLNGDCDAITIENEFNNSMRLKAITRALEAIAENVGEIYSSLKERSTVGDIDWGFEFTM